MCQHAPPCPPAHAPGRAAARIIAGHPEQGWNLLRNRIVPFEDTGMLHPGGTATEPRRAAGQTAADGLPPDRARPRGRPRAARACPSGSAAPDPGHPPARRGAARRLPRTGPVAGACPAAAPITTRA